MTRNQPNKPSLTKIGAQKPNPSNGSFRNQKNRPIKCPNDLPWAKVLKKTHRLRHHPNISKYCAGVRESIQSERQDTPQSTYIPVGRL